MRFATLISTLIFLSASSHAQTPDTTEAWRYLPLAVGNVWEYEEWIEECLSWDICDVYRIGYERWTAEQDSLVGDTTYSVLRVDRFNADGDWGGASRRLVRFDTLAARGFQRYGDGNEEPWPGRIPCLLDAPYDSQIDCDDGWEYVFVYNDGDIEVESGGESETRTVKLYTGLISWSSYAADVGLLSDGAAEFGGSWITLRYALNGEIEYGTRVPVSAEEPAVSASPVSFVVYPNPSRGAATLNLVLDRPQRVTLAVYDVLGRRVLADDLGAQPAGEASHRLDAAGLPAGLYVVRLTGDAGASATARVVLQ